MEGTELIKKIDIGLIINFGEEKVEIKRKVRKLSKS
jgi:hypothetical protein